MRSMDEGKQTAWEDINPVTASAPQPERRVTSSGLEPATREQFAVELTSCLALVAPVGMTEEARREWLSVAWATLKHLPPDILARGCREARLKCDHPAKIVPTIIDETRQAMVWRREGARWDGPTPRLPRPDYCTPAQAAEILREFGLAPNPQAPEE